MTAGGSKSLPAIGFLTVTEHPEHGLFGGYLVLNTAARPLEFHCTAPVRANRAQEILYGPTLKPYLYGEQIGQTLFRKGRFPPCLICTDVEPVLELRSHIDVPVIFLPGAGNEASSPSNAAAYRLDEASERPLAGPHTSFQLGAFRVLVAPSFAGDQQVIRQSWEEHAQGFDLEEPFSRIRGAIEEAQRAAR